LVQQAVYPRTQRHAVVQRAWVKEAKGYRYVGQFRIDAAGRPLPLSPPVGASPTPAGPVERHAPTLDLARLETGGEDFWF
jgi:hypothetical protein